MSKSSQTFQKRQKELKRLKDKQDKQEKLKQRKLHSREGNDLDSMMAYLDENGNIVDQPPQA